MGLKSILCNQRPSLPRPAWPRVPLSRRTFWLLLVAAAAALLWRHAVPASSPAPSQAFIGFLIAAISTLAGWFVTAATASASAILVVVGWLGSALSWLTGRVVDVVKATGSMFAKVWDTTKRLWFDIVRPFLQKVYTWIAELRTWLKEKLAPVFRLLGILRTHIRDIYTHVVRPILDAIDTTRAILKFLELVHVPFARTLDRYLAELEAVISENYLRVLGWVNHVTDVLNSIVTLDLLFQQVPFLATLRRDLPHWVTMFWNAQVVGISPAQRAALAARKYDLDDPGSYGTKLGEFYHTGGGDLAPVIAELVPLWRASAGVK
jgi:hypothetical protein